MLSFLSSLTQATGTSVSAHSSVCCPMMSLLVVQVIDLDLLDKVGSAKGVEELRLQLKQQVNPITHSLARHMCQKDVPSFAKCTKLLADPVLHWRLYMCVGMLLQAWVSAVCCDNCRICNGMLGMQSCVQHC